MYLSLLPYLFLFLLGFILTFLVLKNIAGFYLDARKANVVVGGIIKSEFREHYRKNLSDRQAWVYEACVEYQYSVEGTMYIGNRIYYGSSAKNSNKYQVKKLADSYIVGLSVEVNYLQNNKGKSWLINKVHFGDYVFLFVTSLIMIIGGSLLAHNLNKIIG